MNDEKKLISAELSDDDLDMVSGGASDTVCLSDHNLPYSWYVTCPHCTLGFPAGEGECPSCGGVDVLLGTATATVLWK